MIIAFIIGLFVAGIGALVSISIGNWQFSFAISGVAGIASIIISSILRNVALISKRKALKGDEDEDRASLEGEAWGKAISIFGFPNILITVILYFKLYR